MVPRRGRHGRARHAASVDVFAIEKRRGQEKKTDMSRHERLLTTSALDGILLDIATQIELSPADRRIAENRYRRLKRIWSGQAARSRRTSRTASSLIYAQGSMATSTTIVSGAEDDRFDVDAIVEIDVPAHWSEHDILDVLEAALQGFPGVVKIVRCTRCIQLQFAFMHMDVTIMDRSKRLAIERAGEIAHAPDSGRAYRVPSNPWGFYGVVPVGRRSSIKRHSLRSYASGAACTPNPGCGPLMTRRGHSPRQTRSTCRR